MSISVVKGEDKAFTFRRFDKAGALITEIPDNMWVTVKQTTGYKDFVIQKSYLKGTIVLDQETWYYSFTISSTDTDNLEPGTYVYDVKVLQEGRRRYILKPTEFIIEPCVTRKLNEV